MSINDRPTQTAVRPCPFCGGDSTIQGLGYCGPAVCYDVRVECDDCGARTADLIVDQSIGNVAEQEADISAEVVSAWNRRVA
jgi:Lar family restriction alleviation protein